MPANARVSEPYWHRAGEAGRYTFDEDAPFGLPFRPTPFAAELVLTVGEVPVRDDACRCSIATRATSSAARSAWS